jgi:hypothetical protein
MFTSYICYKIDAEVLSVYAVGNVFECSVLVYYIFLNVILSNLSLSFLFFFLFS